MSALPEIPQHIAIIMDGNGRWAKKRLLPRKAGHHAGAKAVRIIIEACAKRNIKNLTLFAFSSENWQRPADEVETLMDLFLSRLHSELPQLQENQIRLQIIGDRSAFSVELCQRMREVEQLTQGNTRMRLVLATGYGGRWDICQATQRMVQAVQQGQLQVEEINETTLSDYLTTSGLPEPDLLIRTSGEQRLSNFLLWQLAYSELYFTDILWPDFDEQALQHALASYTQRCRRFGFTQEQISD